MLEIVRVAVTLGARFAQPLAQGELVVEAGAAPVVRVLNPVADETVRVGLTAGGGVVQSFVAQGAARVEVVVGGVAGSLPRPWRGGRWRCWRSGWAGWPIWRRRVRRAAGWSFSRSGKGRR